MLTLLIACLLQLVPTPPTTVIITVSNIRSIDGTIRIGIFHNDEAFQKEITDQYFTIEKSEMINGKITKSLKLPAGKCGFSALDDENDNHVMDYNWMGIPKEGYGFANFDHTGFSKPHYEDFEVELQSEGENQLTIKMRYL